MTILQIFVMIIAICQVIRMLQNLDQLMMMKNEKEMRKDLNNQFIDSLSKDNKQWAKDLLEDFCKDTRGD